VIPIEARVLLASILAALNIQIKFVTAYERLRANQGRGRFQKPYKLIN
jgi:hypothetical protein